MDIHDDSNRTEPAPAAGPWGVPEAARGDGWTGDRMAKFCEALAETGLVVDACLAAGKSTVGAYALRRRNPVFAACWEAALTIARERLADTLLARSIEGTVEQYYKDGELVGEKKVIDNRLGLAILRRLDRLAETGSPLSNRAAVTIRNGRNGARACHPNPIDWDLALDALRTGEEDALGNALAMLKGDELNELNDPPVSHDEGDGEPEDCEPVERVWPSDQLGKAVWMTDYPPPPGFAGYQKGKYGAYGYERECSAAEAALLDRGQALELAESRAEDEAERDSWFAALAAGLEPEAADVQPSEQPESDPRFSAEQPEE